MRIVAGRHRGRTIVAPDDGRVRPTSERMREALFNILDHRSAKPNPAGAGRPIQETRILDAFCGTGALGLEALSRGALRCVFMDIDPSAIRICRLNVKRLGEDSRARVLQTDCLNPVPARSPCAILFVDPPYGGDMAPSALEALESAGWIAPGALCFVETGAREPFSAPPGFTILDDRRYGKAALRILERTVHPVGPAVAKAPIR